MKLTHLFIFIPILLCACCEAHFEDHLQKCENKIELPKLKNIDYVYLINLDKRPDRLESTLQQLAPYGIRPYRFRAVCGVDLSLKTLNEVGLVYKKGMDEGHWVNYFDPGGNGDPLPEFLRTDCIGKTLFSRMMRRGAIGCTLSHLSILQDALTSGYETIWVLEDDSSVQQDPHVISDLIEKLDALVGKENWDIFYTDDDRELGKIKDMNVNLRWLWRPDSGPFDNSHFAKRTVISEDFVQIGTRGRTHSMIIRRSGMQKILDFEKKNGMFIPYDHELSLVPNIHLYMLVYPVVTWHEGPSDIQGQK